MCQTSPTWNRRWIWWLRPHWNNMGGLLSIWMCQASPDMEDDGSRISPLKITWAVDQCQFWCAKPHWHEIDDGSWWTASIEIAWKVDCQFWMRQASNWHELWRWILRIKPHWKTCRRWIIVNLMPSLNWHEQTMILGLSPIGNKYGGGLLSIWMSSLSMTWTLTMILWISPIEITWAVDVNLDVSNPHWHEIDDGSWWSSPIEITWAVDYCQFGCQASPHELYDGSWWIKSHWNNMGVDYYCHLDVKPHWLTWN
jgi:hypothetical protein